MTARLLTGLGRLDEADEYLTAAERAVAGSGARRAAVHRRARSAPSWSCGDVARPTRAPGSPAWPASIDDAADPPVPGARRSRWRCGAAADLRDLTGEPGPVRPFAAVAGHRGRDGRAGAPGVPRARDSPS